MVLEEKRAVGDLESQQTFEEVKKRYENRLYEELDELDDPIEVFLSYISDVERTLTEDSELLYSTVRDLMERCLLYFLDMDVFSNDPRYLQVWLWYINMVPKPTADEQFSTFTYLYNKGIGSRLARFYEDFSELLISMEEYENAYTILSIGLDRNAYPIGRLIKNFEALKQKLTEVGIKLPVTASEKDVLFLRSSHVPPFILKYKLNKLSPKPLQNIEQFPNNAHSFQQDKTKKPFYQDEPRSTKIPIFSDSTANSVSKTKEVYKIVEVPGKKPQKICSNFQLLFPSIDEEYCLEEILVMKKRVHYKKSRRPMQKNEESLETGGNKKRKVLSEKPSIDYPPTQPPVIKSEVPDKKIEMYRDEEIAQFHEVAKTSVLPLKDAPAPGSTNLKSNGAPSSPTVTMYSKNAMNEVYSMFNQYYEEPAGFVERDDTTSKFSQFENFTQEFTVKNLDDLTESKTANLTVRNSPESVVVTSQQSQDKPSEPPIKKSKLPEFMTPIKENSTSLKKNYVTTNGSSQNIVSSQVATQSSPFISQPMGHLNKNINSQAPKNSRIIEHPTSRKFRQDLLSQIQPPLSMYKTFFYYDQKIRMSTHLKRMHKASKIENKKQILEFKKADDLYCIVGELGQGGYATVYLAESDKGEIRALKVESPSSKWEYYILKQIEKRLAGHEVIRSIISAYSLHFFLDESYLVLNFANQGTILDLVNYYREKTSGPIDECLCIFLSLEMIKILVSLHKIGIIHGDLKPDNCMIRFEPGQLGYFESQGSNGWDKKGVYLIDFGRSFDMQLLSSDAKFKADWKTDAQDCPEMRKGEPWSFEADYFGLAGIIYSMLFGKLIEVESTLGNRYRIKGTFKRYWNNDIWTPLFDTLLNSRQVRDPAEILRQLGNTMEEHLSNPAVSDQLRNIIYDLQPELVKTTTKRMSGRR
ncbi:protein kinase BUB1 [Nakaseomyces bracarensis]|uniref:protein kinase BUB1 n=1 Tax=Nakaseomyces bracarensis TaxID=273131 RepID=UPI0038710503